jgi:hypothetical protein
MWLSAAVTAVDADFYMKVDDDVHVRVPSLGRFLASHRLTRSMYFGCMKTGPVLGRGLHSSTFRLNLGAFCAIGVHVGSV